MKERYLQFTRTIQNVHKDLEEKRPLPADLNQCLLDKEDDNFYAILGIVFNLIDYLIKHISKFEKDGAYSLLIDEEPLILQITDVEIISEDIPGWIVANKNLLTVALDITVTPELANEGNARELVNRIQKIRKDNGYDLTDRISVKIQDASPLKDSITQFNTYICAEILADAIELVPEIVNGTEIEVNDVSLTVFVTKKD